MNESPFSALLFPLHSIPLHSTPLHSTLLRATPLHSTSLHSTPNYSNPLYSPLFVRPPHCFPLVQSTPFHSTPLRSTPLRSTLLHFAPFHRLPSFLVSLLTIRHSPFCPLVSFPLILCFYFTFPSFCPNLCSSFLSFSPLYL